MRRLFPLQLNALGALLVTEKALRRAVASPAHCHPMMMATCSGDTQFFNVALNGALLPGQLMDAQRARRIQRTRLKNALRLPSSLGEAKRRCQGGYAGTWTDGRIVRCWLPARLRGLPASAKRRTST